jgi:transposase
MWFKGCSLILEGLPMWTSENRAKYDRDKLRYPSDLTDAEWEHIEPLIPPAKRGGRKRTVDLRESGQRPDVRAEHGLPMALCSEGLAAAQHAVRLFRSMDVERHARSRPSHPLCEVPRSDGARSQPHGLRHRQPEREERWKRGRCVDPNGYDAGKKIKGKKRHILVDTVGLLLHAIVHPADIQDRDGGKLVLATMFGLHPFLRKLFADGGYQGPKFRAAQKKILPLLVTEIVKRSDQAKGFEVIPRRWVVERTFAWLGRCRRLAKDFENLTRNALAFIRLASIRLMVRKLCSET